MVPTATPDAPAPAAPASAPLPTDEAADGSSDDALALGVVDDASEGRRGDGASVIDVAASSSMGGTLLDVGADREDVDGDAEENELGMGCVIVVAGVTNESINPVFTV